jgi:hypothetical protein
MATICADALRFPQGLSNRDSAYFDLLSRERHQIEILGKARPIAIQTDCYPVQVLVLLNEIDAQSCAKVASKDLSYGFRDTIRQTIRRVPPVALPNQLPNEKRRRNA